MSLSSNVSFTAQGYGTVNDLPAWPEQPLISPADPPAVDPGATGNRPVNDAPSPWTRTPARYTPRAHAIALASGTDAMNTNKTATANAAYFTSHLLAVGEESF